MGRLAHLLIFKLLAVHERRQQPRPLEGHKLLGGAALLHEECAPSRCECQGHACMMSWLQQSQLTSRRFASSSA